jgi:hypothetical protein
MRQSTVGPGGYGDNPNAPGSNRIIAAAVVVIGILVLAFVVYAAVQMSTGGSVIPQQFFPAGIDRERTLPVDQAPAGQQVPGGQPGGAISPAGRMGGPGVGTGAGGLGSP